jgi:sugar phosphate isomerase/epimerase
LHRRKFFGLSTSAGTALLLSALEASSIQLPAGSVQNANFGLKIMATNWGFKGTLDEYCALVKKEGYDGIEIWWPLEKSKQEELFSALNKHQLDVGFLCGSGEADPQVHLTNFKSMINAAAAQSIQRPLYINCHSGRDHFSFEQNRAFIDHTASLAAQTGIRICHETHRSRMLFAAHITRNFIEKIPALRLTLDISHWCNVHESLLKDQQESVNLALARVDHIHARIGHPEGPQVNDPRAPEWSQAVQAHLTWWDAVVQSKKQKGEILTVLTEFGPPDYMPVMPYSRQPLADQWAINVYMMQLLRKRYLS